MRLHNAGGEVHRLERPPGWHPKPQLIAASEYFKGAGPSHRWTPVYIFVQLLFFCNWFRHLLCLLDSSTLGLPKFDISVLSESTVIPELPVIENVRPSM